ncbi:MAG: hybrid sensor histidine kinase/response regulator, partial [Crocosphaera sp.]|nr:hybrid sensor histidine kinase/response regulator [Crocosphaera sp.]
MNSRYSNPDQFTEESFDEDIAQLFDDLGEDSGFLESEQELDELADLFEKDLSATSWDEESKPAKESPTLSSLPSDEEISELFNDDITWEDDHDGQDETSEAELVNLLNKVSEPWETPKTPENDDEEFLGDLTSVFEEFAENNEMGELQQLLGPNESQQKTPAVISSVYPPLETLNQFLAQPAREGVLDEATVAELAALIAAPAKVEEKFTATTAPAVSSPVTAVSQESDGDMDDDFGELVALLKEADGMGGPPTIAPSPGKRFAGGSTARVTNTKAFEQTMRVPIRQLDNLSNLIGELVVKRNSLEQDQERLRQ